MAYEARRDYTALIAGPNEFGCRLWTGTIHPTGGYGQVRSGPHRGAYVHRAYWEDAHGPVPEGWCVDHWRLNEVLAVGESCQCSRLCVAHLRLVTLKDNLLLSPNTVSSKNKAKTHCPSGHPYDSANTWRSSRGYRYCKQCDRDRHRRREKE